MTAPTLVLIGGRRFAKVTFAIPLDILYLTPSTFARWNSVEKSDPEMSRCLEASRHNDEELRLSPQRRCEFRRCSYRSQGNHQNRCTKSPSPWSQWSAHCCHVALQDSRHCGGKDKRMGSILTPTSKG